MGYDTNVLFEVQRDTGAFWRLGELAWEAEQYSKGKALAKPLILKSMPWALALLFFAYGGSSVLAQTSGAKYFRSPAGWSIHEIEERSAVRSPVICGPSGLIVIPTKSGFRIVDARSGQARELKISAQSSVSCSPDGRYLFVSIARPSGAFSPRYNKYDLTYFDLEKDERVDVFVGLTGLDSDHSVPLVSPNSKYLIGPKELGVTLKLSGGEVLNIVSPEHFSGTKFECPLRWNGDDRGLITYEHSRLEVRGDGDGSSVRCRWRMFSPCGLSTPPQGWTA